MEIKKTSVVQLLDKKSMTNLEKFKTYKCVIYLSVNTHGY